MTDRTRRRRRIQPSKKSTEYLSAEVTASTEKLTDAPCVRRKKRSIEEDSNPSTTQLFKSSLEFSAKDSVRQDSSSSSTDTKSIFVEASPSQSTLISNQDSFLLEERKITNPSLINTIDKIRTEFAEDKRFNSEQKYWGETHNWGSEESDDYWHFLGSYE